MNSRILKLLQNTKADLKSTLENRNLQFRIYTAENKIKDWSTWKALPEFRRKVKDIKRRKLWLSMEGRKWQPNLWVEAASEEEPIT